MWANAERQIPQSEDKMQAAWTRNQGHVLNRQLDMWDWDGPTNGATPWKFDGVKTIILQTRSR